MKYALVLFCLLGAIPAHAEALPMLAYLEDEVSDTSVQDVIDVIAKANEIDNRVILEINTDGGDVDAGFKLAKAIERAKKPVTCVVDGHAFSMGSYIFEACGRRVMTKRSILMIHEAGMQASGHEADFLDAAAEVGALSSVIRALCSPHLRSLGFGHDG